ncbi:MAG: hypothetical protein PHE56_06775 [Bacteroidales bacterium]|nr:hypothetical protein [Bacteroidales bacterium]
MKKEKLIFKFLPADQAVAIIVGTVGCLLFYIADHNHNFILMGIAGVIVGTAFIYSIYSFIKTVTHENNN